MLERTLVIIKPDALCKKVVGKIITRFEQAGFKIQAAKFVWLSNQQAREFYQIHRGKEFYEPLVKFMSSNPSLVMVLKGENAIQQIRKISGKTDSKKAKKGTLRRNFGTDERHNVVHASDSPETTKWEINFFFNKQEIFSWAEKTYRK